MTAPSSPSEQVLEAFGAAGVRVQPLPGGQGAAVRAGPVVLKPVDAAHEDVAAVSRLAIDAGAPLVAPVRSLNGAYVVDGWAATEYADASGLEWQHPDCDWGAVLDAARALHRALATVAVPASFRTVRPESPWARADAAVWSGDLPSVGSEFRAPVRRLAARLQPVDVRRQIVHLDVAGNVLRLADGSRLVIDLSPYVRPAAYAEAVLVVDALLWYAAPLDLVDRLSPVDREQLLLRATLFRLLVDAELHPDDPAGVLGPYDRVLGLLGLLD